LIAVLVKPLPAGVVGLVELAAMEAAAVCVVLDDEPEAVVPAAEGDVLATLEEVDEVEDDVVVKGELDIVLDEPITALDTGCDPPELPKFGHSAFTP